MTARLTFIVPPPGLAPHTEFALDPVDGADGLFTMRAVDAGDPRLYLVDPGTVVDGYAPILSDAQTAGLGLTTPDEAMLLAVARPTGAGVTVNLLAPVVINRTTGAASQVILEDQDYPLRAPLG